MLGGELGVLGGLGEVVAPEGLDLVVEVGVVGTGDGDCFGDDVKDCSSSDLSETAPADVLV